jgi:hypothetical protein
MDDLKSNHDEPVPAGFKFEPIEKMIAEWNKSASDNTLP